MQTVSRVRAHGCPIATDSDGVSPDPVTSRVITNVDPVSAAGADNIVSDLIVVGEFTDQDSIIQVTGSCSSRCDANPVVFDDVVVAKSGRAIDFDPFIRETMDDEAADQTVVGTKNDSTSGPGGISPVQSDQRRTRVAGLCCRIEVNRIGDRR